MNINLDNVIKISKGNKNLTEIKDENNRIIWQYDPEKFETIYCYDKYEIDAKNWKTKTWGVNDLKTSGLWSDGTNIYCTYKGTSINISYVWDNTNKTWNNKTWYGLDDVKFDGADVWTDGTNVYMSTVKYASSTDEVDIYYHLVLNKATDTWTPITWNIDFVGKDTWCKGTDIYLNASRKLDKVNRTWVSFDLGSLAYGWGTNIWTDGTNYYRTYLHGNHYETRTNKYNPTTNTWDEYTWNDTAPVQLDGQMIFSYCGDIYFLKERSPYSMWKLDRNTSTWSNDSSNWTNQPAPPQYGGWGSGMWNFNGIKNCVCTTKKLLW